MFRRSQVGARSLGSSECVVKTWAGRDETESEEVQILSQSEKLGGKENKQPGSRKERTPMWCSESQVEKGPKGGECGQQVAKDAAQ